MFRRPSVCLSKFIAPKLQGQRYYCDYKNFTWQKPQGSFSGIMLYNSITKQKDPLHFINNQSNLTWYSCGPTVYDHSHIGHARCYVQQDIALRILEYFNINLHYVMGITDIDDKIINKAQNLVQDNSLDILNKKSPIQQIASKYEDSFWQVKKILLKFKRNSTNLVKCKGYGYFRY